MIQCKVRDDRVSARVWMDFLHVVSEFYWKHTHKILDTQTQGAMIFLFPSFSLFARDGYLLSIHFCFKCQRKDTKGECSTLFFWTKILAPVREGIDILYSIYNIASLSRDYLWKIFDNMALVCRKSKCSQSNCLMSKQLNGCFNIVFVILFHCRIAHQHTFQTPTGQL